VQKFEKDCSNMLEMAGGWPAAVLKAGRVCGADSSGMRLRSGIWQKNLIPHGIEK
jgi:hypothetical protein